ncbi:DUF1801 domain-containing protein [Chitinimonas sp.]|uniref:DUF1801 domain-containing protein n=1 Tax=Chitinimonas sp. TaxID=1934313 RepID=UPI0035B0D497
MSRPTVQAWLDDIRMVNETNHSIVQTVRALMRQTIEPLSEELKYGGILFASGLPFAGVFAYRAHVSVEFSHGARIQDPYGFLEGSGKGRRHIKLTGIEQVQEKQLAHYVSLALHVTKETVS